jgi:hypothetical protein
MRCGAGFGRTQLHETIDSSRLLRRLGQWYLAVVHGKLGNIMADEKPVVHYAPSCDRQRSSPVLLAAPHACTPYAMQAISSQGLVLLLSHAAVWYTHHVTVLFLLCRCRIVQAKLPDNEAKHTKFVAALDTAILLSLTLRCPSVCLASASG